MKYTPKKGSLTLKVGLKEDDVVSQVSDSGYGIPEAEKARIFQKIYRGSNIVRVDTEGTGLGLYFSQVIG